MVISLKKIGVLMYHKSWQHEVVKSGKLTSARQGVKQGFTLTATSVANNGLISQAITRERGDISVQCNVIKTGLEGFPSGNRMPIWALGGREKANKYTIGGTARTIRQQLHILRPEDTQGSVVQKDIIPSKNGKSLKRGLEIDVRVADNVRLLPKIISFLYRKAELITLEISNPCVAPVIVGSGKRFNIYENPELLPANKEAK
jgi:hypothetical protein